MKVEPCSLFETLIGKTIVIKRQGVRGIIKKMYISFDSKNIILIIEVAKDLEKEVKITFLSFLKNAVIKEFI